MNGWQFVLHQRALEEIDKLQPAERRAVRMVLLRLVEDPWQIPDAQIRPPNDRIYLVKNAGAIRIIYWLDVRPQSLRRSRRVIVGRRRHYSAARARSREPRRAKGSRSGELYASSSPLHGAYTYNWRVALASAPTVYVQTAQTTGARNTFSGLTPGQAYAIQLSAVGSSGASNWSNAAEQIVI